MHAKARATMFFRRACELGDAKVSAFLFPFLFSFLFSFRFHFRFPVPVLCLAGCVLCGFGTWQITQEAWPSEARIPWCKHGTDQACHRASMSKMRGGLLTRLMRRDAIASSSLRMRSRCAALSQCRLPRAVCYNLHAQAACARRSWRVPLEPAMWQQAMCTKALLSSHVHQSAFVKPCAPMRLAVPRRFTARAQGLLRGVPSPTTSPTDPVRARRRPRDDVVW